MVSATQLLWQAAGKPSPRKRVHGVFGESCFWCGTKITQACRVADVCGASFTDWDCASVPSSLWMCEACAWSMTGRPPDTLRLWSIVYREDRDAAPSHEKAMDLGPRIHLQNKADPSEFDAVLRDPPAGPWVCSVADSGQIHVLPFARVNNGSGPWVVRFERFGVSSTPAEYGLVSDAMQALYEAGYSKADIGTLQSSPSRLNRCGVALWRAQSDILRPYAGGGLFQLALFLRRRSHGDRG